MSEKSATERDSPLGTDYLSEIIKSIAASGEDSIAETHTEPKQSTQASTSTDIFSSLLANPELLANLPKIISTVKPLMEMLGNKEAAKPADTAVPTSAGVSSATEKKDTDRRAALLCAMKPYLSPDRCRTIDYVIKLSHLGDILKTL
jgi:hypothetical protein